MRLPLPAGQAGTRRPLSQGRRGCRDGSPPVLVIPAEAGIQDCKSTTVALDPGFRRGDG